MFARLEALLNHLRLRADGKSHDDCLDITTGQHFLEPVVAMEGVDVNASLLEHIGGSELVDRVLGARPEGLELDDRAQSENGRDVRFGDKLCASPSISYS